MAGIPIHVYPPRYGTRPRLGAVTVQPVQQEAGAFYALRSAGDAPGMETVVSQEVLAIAAFFDGEHDIRDVQRRVYEEYGQLLYLERINDVALTLWRAGLLDPPTQAALRHPLLAGKAYPDSPDDLLATLDTLANAPLPDLPPIDTMRGAIVPPFRASKSGQAALLPYRLLRESTNADVFVVIATAQAPMRHPFALTHVDYDTPLGPVPSDVQFLERLAERLDSSFFVDAKAHAHENAIELHALVLRYLYPNDPISLLPVLCSSDCSPTERDRALAQLTDALSDAANGSDVAWIASWGGTQGEFTAPAHDAASATIESSAQAALASSVESGRVRDVLQDGSLSTQALLVPSVLAALASGAQKASLLQPQAGDDAPSPFADASYALEVHA